MMYVPQNLRKHVSPLAMAIAMAGPQIAVAQPQTGQPTVTGHVAFLSDYRFRGVSLSDDEPVVQGSLTFNFNNFYAGAWGSPIDLPDADVEVDLFAGYRFQFGTNTNLSLQLTYVTFPGEDDAHFGRISAIVSRQFDNGLSLGGRLDFEPEQSDSFRADGDNTYVTANAALPIGNIAGKPIDFSASIGFEDGSAADQKIDWSLGASIDALGLVWSIQYIDTDQNTSNGDATALFSVTKNF